MALGKKIIVWDADDMLRGASSSDDLSDGGFSTNTNQVNLINTPGVCYQPAQPTDISENLTGQVIASCEDPAGSAARLMVSQDSGQDGRFFSLSTGYVLTERGAEDLGGDYIQGRTDMIAFDGEAYVTNSTYIVRWQQPNTFNYTFFLFSDTVAPHPALVYENNAYYGDGNLLLRQTAAGATPATILTLPTNQVIVALAVDPGSGKMLISVVGQYNVSDSLNSDARVLYYDGFSPKASKVVQVEQMVTAFPTSEGGLYAAYGNNLGLWNGAGVSFLRNFSRITADNAQLLYKQHFTNVGSTLYLIVRDQIYAHGPISQGGSPIFYPALYNRPDGTPTDMTHITNLGSGLIGLSCATSKLFSWSTTSVSTTPTVGSDLYTNEYDFKEANDGIWLRRVRIFFKNQISNGVSPGTLSFLNEDGAINTVGNGGAFILTNNSGASKAMSEISVGGGNTLRVYQLQVKLALSSINPGIRRIEVFGDPANTK